MKKNDTSPRNSGDNPWEGLEDITESDIKRALENDIRMCVEVWSPKEIERELRNAGIVGQDRAVKAASLIVYNNSQGRPSVNLFCAPSGSGKTEIWRTLQNIYGQHNIVIYDASSITAEGWKGSLKIQDVLNRIPLDKRHHLIIVFDEFDKLLEPQVGSGGTNYSDIVQGQLLKLFDHDIIQCGTSSDGFPLSVDTSGTTIVCLGAFEKLMKRKSQTNGSMGFGAQLRKTCDYSNTEITYESLIEHGMRAELAGRINRIVTMDPLDEKTLVRIGRNEAEKLSEQMKAEVVVDEHTLATLAHTAYEKPLGARWIKSQLQVMLDDMVYDNPDRERYMIKYENTDDSREAQYME